MIRSITLCDLWSKKSFDYWTIGVAENGFNIFCHTNVDKHQKWGDKYLQIQRLGFVLGLHKPVLYYNNKSLVGDGGGEYDFFNDSPDLLFSITLVSNLHTHIMD